MKNLKRPGDLTKGKKLRLNRGIELILRRRETLKPRANIILFQFGKMVSFFRREITIYFEFSFDIRKQRVEE